MSVPILRGPAKRTDAQQLTNDAVRSHSISDGAIRAEHLAEGTVVGTIDIVETLPTEGMSEGDVVYVKPDEKLYRYNGTAWISTVDGADLVENSVTAQAIAAGQVSAIHLAAVLALLSKLIIGEANEDGDVTGARWEFTPQAITGYDNNGEERLSIPLTTYLDEDPASDTFGQQVLPPWTWRGDAEIDHLTVKTLTTLQQTLLAQGSTLTMAEKVSDPSNPPIPTVEYDSVQFTDDGKWSSRYGWTTDGTHFYTCRDAAFGGNDYHLEKWDAAGVRTASLKMFGDYDPFGVVHHDGALYVLCSDSRVRRYSAATLAEIGSAVWPHMDSGNRSPAVGVDPTTGDLLIAQSRAVDDKVRIRRYTYNADNTLTADPGGRLQINTAFTYPNNLSGVSYGQFDLGVNRYVISNRGTAAYRVINTDGTEDTNNIWPSGMASKVGFFYDTVAGRFKSMDFSGQQRTYETSLTHRWSGTATQTWHASYTWGNGTSETKRSTIATFSMNKRARLKVTTPGLVFGVTEARVYLAKGATPGVAPSMRKQGVTTGDTSPTLTITAAMFGSNDDPTTSNFPLATPAKILSAAVDGSLNPLIDLRGDGKAYLRNVLALKVGAAGTTLTEIKPRVTSDLATIPALSAGASTTVDFPMSGVTVDHEFYFQRTGAGNSLNLTRPECFSGFVRMLVTNTGTSGTVSQNRSVTGMLVKL